MDHSPERLLQAGLDALNAAQPFDMVLPNYIGQARHGCRKHRLSGAEGREISSPLEVREVYAYGWAEDGSPILTDTGTGVALMFKQGVCRRCGHTGRSEVGRVVNVAERPPLYGRVAR